MRNEGASKRVYNHLKKWVVVRDYCLACGACVASCPFDCLAMEEEAPVLKKACTNCGICYEQCPQVIDPRELERQVFMRNASDDESLGIYQRALSVETRDADIKIKAQDGGAVTTILSSLLDYGFIDGAIVMGVGDQPWRPFPRVAVSREGFIEGAGSKYSRGPLFLGLRDAADLHYLSRMALVGTPCQIAAGRRAKLSELTNRRLSEAIKLYIGIFCWRAFEYKKFFEEVIEGQLRIPLPEVAKFDIKQERLIIYRKQKPKRELSLDTMEKYAYSPCRLCWDYTAELADISVGAMGSPSGRSTVLLRTPIGAEAFDVASKSRKLDMLDLGKVKPGIEKIRDMSRDKKMKATKQLESLRAQNKPLPVWEWESKVTEEDSSMSE